MTNKRVPNPVYEVYKCKTMNCIYEVEDGVCVDAFLYRVKLYLIFCDDRVYTFFNPTDWVDNFQLMREGGSSCSTFTHDIMVSPDSHRDIYDHIRLYVSSSDSN